jgi:methylamine dehydrogenase accessory protein MauD
MLAVALAVLWVVVIAQGLAIVVLTREVGRLYLRLGPARGARVTDDGPEIGETLARVEVRDQRGSRWTIGGPRAEPLLLLFMTEQCPACDQLALSIPTFARSHPELRVLSLFGRLSTDSASLLARIGLQGLPAIVDGGLPDTYGVRRFPYALLVDEQGRLLSKGIVNGLDHLESLCRPLEVRRAGRIDPSREISIAAVR